MRLSPPELEYGRCRSAYYAILHHFDRRFATATSIPGMTEGPTDLSDSSNDPSPYRVDKWCTRPVHILN